ncbi:MAG TPA: hypothetical protein VHC97_03605 [Thermoanaerobaculia bacterium]|jgi:hypothetical protein|nr:hypothetical protein [Thermoanaerobaculia bacterium]
MTRAVFALTLLLAALPAIPAMAQAPPACPKGQSVRDVDPDTHVVIQKTRLTPKPDSFDPMLLWTSDEPGSVTFVVMGNGAIVRYPTCYGLTLLADGRTVALGQTEHNAETGGSRAVEYMTSEIPLAEARRLASAKAVTFKICNDEFRVSEDFLCQAREVLEAASSWKTEAPARK